MTSDPQQPSPFTPEELAHASSAEQEAFVEAQLEHLRQRVVTLRLNLERVVVERDALRDELERVQTEDKSKTRRQPAKKTTSKTPTQ